MLGWTGLCGSGIAAGYAFGVGEEAAWAIGTIWLCFLPFSLSETDDEDE